MYRKNGMMRFAADENRRDVQFIMIASQPYVRQMSVIMSSDRIDKPLCTFVWNGMTRIHGRIEDQNIAQGVEQMFPRSRLYRMMIINTGIEVISTASGGSEQRQTKNAQRKHTHGEHVD